MSGRKEDSMNPNQVIIRDLGKFEAEPEYVLAFWNLSLESGYDETIEDGADGEATYIFLLTDEDRTIYGFDADDQVLAIWETSQGFVCHRLMTEAEYANERI
jgi:hypothetical protein